MKKAKKLVKILLLSLFIGRIFYLCKDIVCTCDTLADPCSIETFDNGIILVFEMIALSQQFTEHEEVSNDSI